MGTAKDEVKPKVEEPVEEVKEVKKIPQFSQSKIYASIAGKILYSLIFSKCQVTIFLKINCLINFLHK